MTVFAFGDTVRLKDGSIIKGKIVSFGGGKFVILIDDGTRQRQMSFTADEVEKIEFDNQTMPVSMVKTSNNKSYEKTPPTVTKSGNNTVITVGQKIKLRKINKSDRRRMTTKKLLMIRPMTNGFAKQANRKYQTDSDQCQSFSR